MHSSKIKTDKKRCCRRRHALTVVELLAATLLASMLMIAVLGVLKSITQGQKQLLSHGSIEPWQMRLEEQLEWDLANSQSFQAMEDGVQLEGFAGRDFESRAAIHCRTLIRYAIVKQGEQMCLVRHEIHPDSLHLTNDMAELVCNDIERIVIATPHPEGATGGSEINVESPEHNFSDGPLPDRLAVALYKAGESAPVFYHVFMLR